MENNVHSNLKAPGWNDPPTVSYDRGCEIVANAPPKRSLNKRVGLSLNQPYKSAAGVDPTIPPAPIDTVKIGTPPPSSLPPPPKTKSEPSQTADVPDENLRDRLRDVLFNLSSCDVDRDEEIAKRFLILENMWLDNKLDNAVMKKVIELSNVLKAGDVDAADKMQKSLMVDHISQCSAWMGGVRQLINKIKPAVDDTRDQEK